MVVKFHPYLKICLLTSYFGSTSLIFCVQPCIYLCEVLERCRDHKHAHSLSHLAWNGLVIVHCMKCATNKNTNECSISNKIIVQKFWDFTNILCLFWIGEIFSIMLPPLQIYLQWWHTAHKFLPQNCNNFICSRRNNIDEELDVKKNACTLKIWIYFFY